jgi:hypothetical protein
MVSSLILDQAPKDSGRGSVRRRLITLIFVDRGRSPAIIIVIRRELPRTRGAGPAMKACRIAAHEDSPLPCAIPAADHWCLYEIHSGFHPAPLIQAARRTSFVLRARSASMPIAQMNPRSSRATAVTACCLHLPRAIRRI